MKLTICLSVTLALLTATGAIEAKPIDPVVDRPWSLFAKREVPAGLMKRGEIAVAAILLDVSADGKPTGCRITLPSGIPTLDNQTCDLYMKNASFRPARDSAGMPVAGTYEAPMIWTANETAIDAATSKAQSPKAGAESAMWVTTDDIPQNSLVRGEAYDSNFRLTVAADGTIKQCGFLSGTRKPELDRLGCKLILARGRFSPARDANGKPTAGTAWQSVRWQLPPDRSR